MDQGHSRGGRQLTSPHILKHLTCRSVLPAICPVARDSREGLPSGVRSNQQDSTATWTLQTALPFPFPPDQGVETP